jgi:hypothetical protein
MRFLQDIDNIAVVSEKEFPKIINTELLSLAECLVLKAKGWIKVYGGGDSRTCAIFLLRKEATKGK